MSKSATFFPRFLASRRRSGSRPRVIPIQRLVWRLKNEYQAALGRLAIHLGAAPVNAVPVVPAAAPVARATAETPDIDAEMTKEEVAVKEAEKDEAGAERDREAPDPVSDHFIPDRPETPDLASVVWRLLVFR